MSKGSTIVPVRVPAPLLEQLDAAVASDTRGEPWTRSSFILKALRMELARRERARKWRPKKGRRKTPAAEKGEQ